MAILAEIDGIRGEFKSDLKITPPGTTITNLKRSTLITSAGASTRIEGAKLNDDEVEKVMRGLAAFKFADRDLQEVQGYLETLQNVFDTIALILCRFERASLLHFINSFLNILLRTIRIVMVTKRKRKRILSVY